jgi:hypothetical protein
LNPVTILGVPPQSDVPKVDKKSTSNVPTATALKGGMLYT